MDTPSLRAMVLERVTRWKHLPLSDVIAMLPPVVRPRLRLELLEGMRDDGLITLRQLGDELVLTLVERPVEGQRPAEGRELGDGGPGT